MSFYRTEPTPNPDTDTRLQDGVTCKGCDHFMLDASDEEAHKCEGWWCADCFYALHEAQEATTRAVKTISVRDVQDAIQAVAARGDQE